VTGDPIDRDRGIWPPCQRCQALLADA